MPVTIKSFLWIFPVFLTLLFLLFIIDENDYVSKLPLGGRNAIIGDLVNRKTVKLYIQNSLLDRVI